MNVLGMIAFGKNPGACLLRDGRLVAFAEEERFTRFKGSHGFFPGRSVEYCLQEAGLRLGEVDRIAFAWDAGKYPYHMLASLARQFVKYRGAAARAYHHESNGTRAGVLAAATNVLKYTPGMLRDEIRLGLRAQGLKGDVPPIEFVSHHLCHAYPTYTKFGGHYFADRYTDALVKLVTGFDPALEPVAYGEKIQQGGAAVSKYLDPRYVDLAWGVQEKLEEAAKAIVNRAVKEYGIPNLCIAGGVGLNCKMNGELLQATPVERIFVQPASNDAGTSIGAAMIVAQAHGDRIWNELENVYYGPGFSNADIRQALDGCKVPYEEASDIVRRTADDIAAGKIVGWFQGRMECGARALGGRSILANPVFPGIKGKVNCQVKYRESWRPFCPSLVDGAKDEYLEGAAEAPFMIVAFPVKPDKRSLIPSAVHVDGTVRPQTVTEHANPRFHELLCEVGKRTGHPVVVNTSFNVRGEPIICTPLDAVRCFYSTGLDTLAIGDFVLTKR